MRSTKSPTLESFSERTSSILRNMKLKDRVAFFLEKPMYAVCLVRTKEQVGEERSTVGTHMNADCLLKNLTFTYQR